MKTFRLWIYKRIASILPETRFFTFKSAMLRWAGAKVGRNVRINSSAVFQGNGGLEIGDDVWIGAECFMKASAPAKITIGSHCDFATRCIIETGSHRIDPDGEHIAGEGYRESVKIGDGCWLGIRTVVLAGVSLQPKTLVAAGAVVTKSCNEACCLLAGVPAKLVKSYSDCSTK